MKSRSIKIGISLTAVLALFLVVLACDRGPQNTNQGHTQNQELNKANANPQVARIGPDWVCKVRDFDPVISDIKERILEKMTDDLKNQHSGNVNRGGNVSRREARFKYDVIKPPDANYLVAYFENGVSSTDGLKDLANILNDFDDEDECLLKVYFVPKGTFPISAARNFASFEWSACEWPTVACPSGICHEEPCPRSTPPVTNSNSNTNSNANKP